MTVINDILEEISPRMDYNNIVNNVEYMKNFIQRRLNEIFLSRLNI